MTNDRFLPFAFPAVASKKITAAFDGGRITSDGGVMVLAQAERRLAIAEKLAAVIADPRDPLRLVHRLPQILRARILAIACGYEDANDLDRLRFDPAFKLACGRLPDSGLDLCSQPTMSRWENAPNLREVIRLMGVMIDLYCASYATPPVAVTLDIDDTLDVVHGHQQLSLFNAHYDERCFLPIHVYDVATSRRLAVLLRPGKTPSGQEVTGHLRRLVRRIRRHWPTTRITLRGDSHYGRPEVMISASKTTSTLCSGFPATARSIVPSRSSPTISAPSERSRRRRCYADMPRRCIGPSPGRSRGAPVPASRPHPSASTSATSSPASPPVRPSTSTTPSIVRAARPRT